MTVEQGALLTPAQAGEMFGVDPKTIMRWALSGLIPATHYEYTLGGHRRFYRDSMEQLRDQFKEGKDNGDV